MTIPNVISAIRIIIAPIVLLLLTLHNYNVALFLFVVAGVSDIIDGYLARHYNQRSRLGSYLDPLADKLLVVMISSYFVVLGEAPWWWLGVVFSREILLLIGVLLLKNFKVQVEILPMFFGKSSTVFNMLAAALLILSHIMSVPPAFILLFVSAASVLTFISFLQYAAKWFELYGKRSNASR